PASFATTFRLIGQTLLIDLGKPRRVLSSAPRGGGFTKARYVVNHQVEANPIAASIPAVPCQWRDPSRYLGSVARSLGADHRSVGLMTAVPIEQVVVMRETEGPLWVEGFFTVGVSNAVRAGEPTGSPDGTQLPQTPGTINMILVTNARLSMSAMVGAVQVATEGKAAVLLSAGVPSWTGLPGATGTGTDTVVVACGSSRAGPVLRYSGTHTKIGELIGRLVGRGVKEGLARSARWSKSLPTR
ncbi:MAG: adenosylcobinamide amidohydrolase, partial [Nitrospirae bacterium]|nr:adenosylcobinamide amidohydrolase [Nitrospirota bacterium]